jgi:hypothetical protein
MAVSILLPQDPTSSQPAVLTPTPPHRARRPDRPMHTPRAPTDRHRPPHRRPPTARTQPHPPARPTDPPTGGREGGLGRGPSCRLAPTPPRARRSFVLCLDGLEYAFPQPATQQLQAPSIAVGALQPASRLWARVGCFCMSRGDCWVDASARVAAGLQAVGALGCF